MWSYLEQRLGAATVPGGFSAVARVLAARLGTRGVEVRLGASVADVLVRRGRAQGVRVDGEEVAADVVVVAVDPRRLPTLARHVRRTTPVDPPDVVHLGLVGGLDGDLAHETVLHGSPDLLLHRGGVAPEGSSVLTVVAWGLAPGTDLLARIAEHGVDLRDRLVARVDRSPAEVGAGGSPYGVAWEGRATAARRLGPRTPVEGIYAAGAHAAPGAGVPFVGLSAAQVAQVVGPA